MLIRKNCSGTTGKTDRELSNKIWRLKSNNMETNISSVILEKYKLYEVKSESLL